MMLEKYLLSVLGLNLGCTIKYSPLPSGVPSGFSLGNSIRQRLYLTVYSKSCYNTHAIYFFVMLEINYRLLLNRLVQPKWYSSYLSLFMLWQLYVYLTIIIGIFSALYGISGSYNIHKVSTMSPAQIVWNCCLFLPLSSYVRQRLRDRALFKKFWN